MSDILLIGLNHKTASIELRERIAFSNEEVIQSLEALNSISTVNEALLISTCNRTEIVVTSKDIPNTEVLIKNYLSDFKKITLKQLDQSLYIYTSDEAIRHLFRVASSLDSMVVGEPQILGQIKAAYETATQQQSTGAILNRLLHKAFFTAKKIRNETGIGNSAISISYAAIELGKKIFGTLEKKSALLIGAGEMAELAVEHLIRNKADDIFVCNRTFKRGVDLSDKFNGTAIRFEELKDHLQIVDIVISSTGATDFVITREMVKSIMRARKNRPIFFIDIAVPRDIDPDINRLNNAYVYDIDDLEGIIDDNIEERKKEAIKGERIVDEAVIRFRQWIESLEVVPTIVALRNKMEAIAQSEIEKTTRLLKNVSDNDKCAIKKMSDTIINKILHDPTIYLKKNNCTGEKSNDINITRKLFNLDE